MIADRISKQYLYHLITMVPSVVVVGLILQAMEIEPLLAYVIGFAVSVPVDKSGDWFGEWAKAEETIDELGPSDSGGETGE